MTQVAQPRLPDSYWRLWGASTISNLGDGMYLVAMPLIAAELTRSEVRIALIAACAALPWMLFSIPVGAMVDRLDRRQIMIAANLCRGGVIGVIAVLVATDIIKVWMLWLAALLLGIGEVFFDNATMALVPRLVPEAQLPRANGRLYAAELGANGFLGTPLGGVLFAVATFLPFMIDAWSFVIAALLLLSITSLRQGDQRPPAPRGGHSRLRDDIREGWQFLLGHEILRPLAGAFALVSIAFQMPLAVLVLFVRETLGLGPRGYAVILTVITIGPVVGGMFGDRLVRRVGRSTSLTVALTTWGICLLATALYPHAWFVALAATMQAIATAVWNMTTVSLRQVLVPNELFGRVNSIYRWFGWGMIPVGALLGAGLASWLGLRAPYVAAAAVIVVAWLIVRRLDRAKVDEATASMVRPAS